MSKIENIDKETEDVVRASVPTLAVVVCGVGNLLNTFAMGFFFFAVSILVSHAPVTQLGFLLGGWAVGFLCLVLATGCKAYFGYHQGSIKAALIASFSDLLFGAAAGFVLLAATLLSGPAQFLGVDFVYVITSVLLAVACAVAGLVLMVYSCLIKQ